MSGDPIRCLIGVRPIQVGLSRGPKLKPYRFIVPELGVSVRKRLLTDLHSNLLATRSTRSPTWYRPRRRSRLGIEIYNVELCLVPILAQPFKQAVLNRLLVLCTSPLSLPPFFFFGQPRQCCRSRGCRSFLVIREQAKDKDRPITKSFRGPYKQGHLPRRHLALR